VDLIEAMTTTGMAAHVAVGYPAHGFPAKLSRLPVEQIAFAETYGQVL
jgi:hypothetical protein